MFWRDRLCGAYGEKQTMKILIAAVAILGLLASPAAAQFKRGGGPSEEKVDPHAAKRSAAEERAYKAALDRIPEAKQKYDPWGGVVPADTAKKPK
jgi:hypothetical protein